MLKQFTFLSLVVNLTLIGLPPFTSCTQAASAVAEDNAGNLFAYSNPNINQAVAGAMALCLQQGAGGAKYVEERLIHEAGQRSLKVEAKLAGYPGTIADLLQFKLHLKDVHLPIPAGLYWFILMILLNARPL